MNEQITPANPVEEQISQELVKHNVTDALIEKLKTDYMPLQIKGIDDKETYLLVKDARKECKKWRVMAEKICKEGRSAAVAIQKAWVAKEKEVTDKIGEVEDHLEKQEKEFEAQVAAEKERRRREQEEQLILRQQALTSMGVLYSDGHFILGEVSFEMSLIKECDPDIWEQDIKSKFEEEYKKLQAEELERERIKQEREAELKRQQDELERRQREIEEKEAALKAAQEEQERKEREEHDRRMAAAKAKEEATWKVRADQLQALGLKIEIFNNHLYYNGYDCSVSHLDITGYSDEKWDQMIQKITPHIAGMKALEEEKRLAEIEAQKESERVKTLGKSRMDTANSYNAEVVIGIEGLGKLGDAEWNALSETWRIDHERRQREKWEKEQEEKRKAEELKKQQEMEQAKDKEKWQEMQRQVNEIEVYDMRSSQYRTKAMKFRQKLDEIKALFDGQN